MSNKTDSVKVAVDSKVAEKIPTVAVSNEKLNPEQYEPEVKNHSSIVTTLIKSIVNFFMDFLETIVVALSIFVVVYLFMAQPHEVKGSSMEPNFHNNEYILTDKISYRFKTPNRGDVIIFKAPTNPELDYIKRVIGLPSEKVKIEKGKVYVNDLPLNEEYLDSPTTLFPSSTMKEGVDITISVGEYFVLGDNRGHSSDSREFGPISSDLIIGRAFIRYWPLTAVGTFSQMTY